MDKIQALTITRVGNSMYAITFKGVTVRLESRTTLSGLPNCFSWVDHLFCVTKAAWGVVLQDYHLFPVSCVGHVSPLDRLRGLVAERKSAL